MLKEIEKMIDVQKIVKDMMKITEKANMMIMEIKRTILKASINNQTMNVMNILRILEDLWYLIQSNMKDQTFQIQRILADELDAYRGRENSYVNNNIQEIQKLYKDKEQKKKEGTIEDKKVILIKPYEISGLALSTTKLSFINNEVNNLLKYMKFIQLSIQTRIF